LLKKFLVIILVYLLTMKMLLVTG